MTWLPSTDELDPRRIVFKLPDAPITSIMSDNPDTTDEPTDEPTDDESADDSILETKLNDLQQKVRDIRERLSTSYDDMVDRCTTHRKSHYENVTANADEHSVLELIKEWLKLGGSAYAEGFARLLRWTYESGRDGTISLFHLLAGTTAVVVYTLPVATAYRSAVRPVAQFVAQRVARGAAKRVARGAVSIVRTNLPLILGAIIVGGIVHYLYHRMTDDEEEDDETSLESDDDEDTKPIEVDVDSDPSLFDVTLDISATDDDSDAETISYEIAAPDRAEAIEQAKDRVQFDVLNFENRTITHSSAVMISESPDADETDDATLKPKEIDVGTPDDFEETYDDEHLDTFRVTLLFSGLDGTQPVMTKHKVNALDEENAIHRARYDANSELDNYSARTLKDSTASPVADEDDDKEIATDGGYAESLQSRLSTFVRGDDR